MRSGIVYTLRSDGNLDAVAPDGRRGVFTPNADWVSGELGEVSRHMCDLLGGRQLPPRAPEPRAAARVTTVAPFDPNDLVARHRALAAMQRESLRGVIGNLADRVADIEFASVYFTLFPNFHPWGSFNRIVYRFRPNGNNPDESIMECMFAPIPADGVYRRGSDPLAGTRRRLVEARSSGCSRRCSIRLAKSAVRAAGPRDEDGEAAARLVRRDEAASLHRLLDEWINKP
jgi:hypothetical protein